jgi:hypothetical protein
MNYPATAIRGSPLAGIANTPKHSNHETDADYIDSGQGIAASKA